MVAVHAAMWRQVNEHDEARQHGHVWGGYTGLSYLAHHLATNSDATEAAGQESASLASLQVSLTEDLAARKAAIALENVEAAAATSLQALCRRRTTLQRFLAKRLAAQVVAFALHAWATGEEQGILAAAATLQVCYPERDGIAHMSCSS